MSVNVYLPLISAIPRRFNCKTTVCTLVLKLQCIVPILCINILTIFIYTYLQVQFYNPFTLAFTISTLVTAFTQHSGDGTFVAEAVVSAIGMF